MHYQFPLITNFEDILPAIEGADEFVVKRSPDSGILIVNYLFAAGTTFPDPDEASAIDEQMAHFAKIRRECRGIKFDIETGKVVARPFAKFFNLLEKPETQLDRIDWTRPHRILEKLDGSMITSFRRKDGTLEWHTKMGHTDVALPVEDFINQSCIEYERFVDAVREETKTAIFEWCSLKQRIVIPYFKDALILTAIRDNLTGNYTPYEEMVEIANEYGIPVVRALPGSVENIQKFMAETRDAKGIEGYIIRFDNGHMLKLKAQEYVLIHGTKDELSRETQVWDMVLNDWVDDIKPFMDELDRKWIEEFIEDFDAAIEKYAHRLNERVEEARTRLGTDKKAFAMEIAGDKHDKGMMFSIWDGKNSLEVVLNFLRKNIGSQPKIDAVRHVVSGVKWTRGKSITE